MSPGLRNLLHPSQKTQPALFFLIRTSVTAAVQPQLHEPGERMENPRTADGGNAIQTQARQSAASSLDSPLLVSVARVKREQEEEEEEGVVVVERRSRRRWKREEVVMVEVVEGGGGGR